MRASGTFLLALGAAGPPATWFATQQAAGTLTYFACEAAGPPWGLLIGLAGLGACVAAAALNWQRLRAEAPGKADFGLRVGLGLAGVFGLTNLFMIAAIVLVPPCAR